MRVRSAPTRGLFKNPAIDASKAIQIAATINRQPTMMVVDVEKPWKTVAEVTAATKEKGQDDLRHPNRSER